jgi:hypothetical protein
VIVVTAHRAAPTTCTPQDKQTRFSKRNKDKRARKSLEEQEKPTNDMKSGIAKQNGKEELGKA